MPFPPAVNVSPITRVSTGVDTPKRRCISILNRFRMADTQGKPAAVRPR